MKQIKYTKEQLLVIDIVNELCSSISQELNDTQRNKLFETRKKIFSEFSIGEKYLTLRQFLEKNSYGAYHRFYFTINNIKVENITGVDEFESIYNSSLLDKHYVVDDEEKMTGNSFVEHICHHYLKLVKK